MSEPWSSYCGLLTNQLLSKRELRQEAHYVVTSQYYELRRTFCNRRIGEEGYVGSNIHKASNVLLPTLPVKVRANNDHKVVETFAFLDPGSTAPFCAESLLSKLKVTLVVTFNS